ncbi:MAG: DUF2971 domain-containing protein [Clostridiales bacterium]|nr:DUF2971 domain-containing protein [Clostridiales bacterium]
MGFDKESWLREQLTIAFQDSSQALQFIEEKKCKLNNKLYKYCPISDTDDIVQYPIENLKNDIIYMSRVSNFNDPFDTYISFDLNNTFENFIPKIIEMNTELDGELKPLVSVVLSLLMAKRPLKEDCLNNPQLFEIVGVDGREAKQVQQILNGQFPKIEAAKEAYQKMIESVKTEISNGIKKSREIINEKYYISCFSTSSNNALMWAHYSNKHKGFCIEYDLEKTRNTNFLINLYPVLYSKKRATIPSNLFDITATNNIKISTSNESIVDLLCALLTKSDIWKYEDEWRLLLYGGTMGVNDNKFKIDCINKIILGCQIEDKYEKILTQICKTKEIHLSKMLLDENEYQIHEEIIF